MGALAPVFTILGTVAGVAGTIMQAKGIKEEGREQRDRFLYEKKVAEQKADEATAAAQRDSMARYREGRFLLSQQQAALAANGGSLADASVIDLMDDTQEQVALSADTEMFKGEQQRRGYTDAAKVAAYDAESAMMAAKRRATGVIVGGVSTMFSRFGEMSGGFKGGSASTGATLPYG